VPRYSHHQGPIDWGPLAPNATRFTYIKATEGGDWTDSKFTLNWEQARAIGLPRGAYHFYTLCRPVDDQIAHIIATVPKEPDTLPIAIDLEFGGNCKGRPSIEQFQADLIKLLKELETHYGHRPILYLTREFDEFYMKGAFENERYWLRSIIRHSIIRQPASNWRPWLFWQYHNKGRRDGVTGPVDLNAFNGNEEEWQQFLLALPE